MTEPTDSDVQHVAPLLPLRDIIVFPNMVVPLFVGREKSIAALQAAMEQGREIVLCAQRKAKTNEPAQADIYSIGTMGTIRQMIQLPDGTVKVLVMGTHRVRVLEYLADTPFFRVALERMLEECEEGEEAVEVEARVRETFESYVKLNRRIPGEILSQISKIEDPSQLSDTIIAHIALKLADKQRILEMTSAHARLRELLSLMSEEIEILQVEKKIRSRVKKQMEKTQNESEDAQPSGESASTSSGELGNEMEELEAKIRDKAMPAHARERAEKELRKLRLMSPMSAEATVVRNYIDWILNLPWEDFTEERLDVTHAEEVLDADHYGLEKPKERILEYLAVRALVERPRGPILCLVGPPGVGKTSLGRSVARALNRNFVRISLGGVRDEAEIRGHRRTYIGAMPGKIIQSLRRAESSNPVFLLDEVDKMSMDFRGDPSSAMLEVLDPEQNPTFNDHYLDLDFDLSGVLFLCTANSLQGIPAPLQDRMEIIQLPGYTDAEKRQIARTYLIPKQIEQNGLTERADITFTDTAIDHLIHHYTREAGVRNLEREVGGVCRKIAREVVKAGEEMSQDTAQEAAQDAAPETQPEAPSAQPETRETPSFKVNARAVRRYLGPHRFTDTRVEQQAHVGLTNGLAWTQYGGVMLVSEATVLPGSGKFMITGKLGDVMQESAQAAMSYVRSRAINLGLAPTFHQQVDIHVHFPEGALPKDGPSAGITMATSLVSCLTQIPVRHDVAMTGEITLRGRVMPIGGLKEKLIAAHRQGIRTALIPTENVRDLRDLPTQVRRALEIIPVAHMDDVLVHALVLEDPDAFKARLSRPAWVPSLGEDTEAETLPGVELPGVSSDRVH